MVNLVEEVIKVKLILLDFLLETLGFFFVILLLSSLNQADHVTHTEDTVSHTLRIEDINSLHLLTGTDELDRLVDNRTDTEGSTATSITIELSQYHTVKVKSLVKLLRGINCILAGHRVNHKESLIRINSILETRDFIHHLFVNSQTTGSINDNQVIAFSLGLVDGVERNLYYILVTFFGIDRHTNLSRNNLKLLNSSRTIDVASHEQRFLTIVSLQPVCKFTSKSSFT